MISVESLRRNLLSLDGKGYGAYKSIRGSYGGDWFRLFIDHVQADPFAPPSRARLRVPHRFSGFPPDLYKSNVRRVALQDFVARSFYRLLRAGSGDRAATGGIGLVTVDRCGQEVLDRTAVLVTPEFIEVRFAVGLPARGRTVLGREAAGLLTEYVPRVAEKSMLYKNLSREKLVRHVEVVEDQEYLRGSLGERGLVAFVGNGSVLPRESGVSDLPLAGPQVIKFQSPPGLQVEFNLPNRGRVAGMGIPRGVTLIVGGGYHGKSTLLRALERGVYNHVPGDGRELVVTVADAVKIRSEDGRRVEKVDIGGFISNLPFGQDTRTFSTENASGSTSQAANIMEALESGASLLLLDEDTSATNFMIRDSRMQRLVAKENEPITPFIDRVRDLLDGLNVSTILVVGGSGDYLGVADLVIMMQNYRALDVTETARKIVESTPGGRIAEAAGGLDRPAPRAPLPAGGGGSGRIRVKARGVEQISFGRDGINLACVDQLVDPSQTRAVAEIIRYAFERYVDGTRPLSEVADKVLEDIDREGLDVISPFERGQHPGDFARPRKQEIMAAFNRLRGVRMRSGEHRGII
ncbi:MAG: ABC-ATPase domain-containing protein [Peptococcaceae bacterium]|nr:ABC-ATPase domain-containing protein [Peptococcaceae bacterium]